MLRKQLKDLRAGNEQAKGLSEQVSALTEQVDTQAAELLTLRRLLAQRDAHVHWHKASQVDSQYCMHYLHDAIMH